MAADGHAAAGRRGARRGAAARALLRQAVAFLQICRRGVPQRLAEAQDACLQCGRVFYKRIQLRLYLSSGASST